MPGGKKTDLTGDAQAAVMAFCIPVDESVLPVRSTPANPRMLASSARMSGIDLAAEPPVGVAVASNVPDKEPADSVPPVVKLPPIVTLLNTGDGQSVETAGQLA